MFASELETASQDLQTRAENYRVVINIPPGFDSETSRIISMFTAFEPSVFLSVAASNRTVSRVYGDMAEVVAEIGNEFENLSDEEIFRLAEPNHLFSGRENGSGFNLTFTDERIRGYGVKLQQLIQRVLDAPKKKDTPNPLTQEQLMPVRYG